MYAVMLGTEVVFVCQQYDQANEVANALLELVDAVRIATI